MSSFFTVGPLTVGPPLPLDPFTAGPLYRWTPAALLLDSGRVADHPLAGQRPWQAEEPQDAVVRETSDARHPVAGEGEHDQALHAGDGGDWGGRVAQVAAERRLAIRPGSDE